MNLIEKLEKYFNTGSTDKQNKRRLGGLLIAITAILLVLSMLLVAGGGVWALVDGIIDAANQPDEVPDDGLNHDLVDVAASDVTASTKFTKILLEGTAINLTTSDYVVLSRPNRSFVTVGEEKVYLYGCQKADYFALQTEAHTAFNALISKFYETEGKKIFVYEAYDTTDGALNGSNYSNALAIKLYASTDELEKICPIYDYETSEGGDDSYEWIFENAYKYGFVRVSDAEGEESVFRYVGLSHAKYIYDKQKAASKSDEGFYGLDSYIAELKATTPDKPMNIKRIKTAGEGSTVACEVYYMTVVEGATCKLPKNSYDYDIQQLTDGGYVVTYWKASK